MSIRWFFLIICNGEQAAGLRSHAWRECSWRSKAGGFLHLTKLFLQFGVQSMDMQ